MVETLDPHSEFLEAKDNKEFEEDLSGEFGGDGRPFQLPRADLKYFLTEFHSQSPITAAIGLRQQVAVEDIEAVTAHTYWFAWSEIASEPEKWHPTTRESGEG